MARVEVNDLANIGVVKDSSSYQMEPEALTLAENVRFVDNAIERLGGYEAAFGVPGVPPHFVVPVAGPTQLWWLYTSLTKAYVYDGEDHTNITRQTASVDVDYSANETRDWQATILGGIPILNNGFDMPQFWPDYDVGDRLQDLTNWPTSLRAKIIRAFGPFLIAYHVTDTGVVFPHRVRWSHPADPGSVPVSWAIDDPSLDGGQVDLADSNAGLIMDAVPLAGDMFIYKENSIWRQRLTGGQNIFSFTQFVENVGALAPRCVGITGDGQRHFIATQDNLVYHNGNTVVPILNKRMRRELFNAIDPDSYQNSFVFCNTLYDEMWFCYPEQGSDQPNRAIIWNYGHGTERGVVSEASIDFRNVDQGTVQSAGLGVWEGMPQSWAEMTELWNKSNRRKLIAVDPTREKFYQLDTGYTRDGRTYTSIVQRDALGVVGKKRDGSPVVDFTKMKHVPRVWPKITGDLVEFRLGFRDLAEASMQWEEEQDFDPAEHRYCDFDGCGVFFAYEISSSGEGWRCDGLIFEVNLAGEF